MMTKARCLLLSALYLCLLLLLLQPQPGHARKQKSSDNTTKAVTSVTTEGGSEESSVDLKNEVESSISNIDETAIIEENPNYDPEAVDDDDDEDSDDDGGDDDGELADSASAKEKLAVALRQTRRKTRKTIKFLKVHRSELTLGLTIFAFRREIRDASVHIFKKSLLDPKTGKVSLTRLHPTSVLKIVLFVDFMRRLQGKSRAGSGDDNTRNVIAQFGKTNPLLASMFTKLLNVPTYNPAFVPPIHQHYTFERVNERYVKDGLALHKALHANQGNNNGDLKWPTSDFSISQPISKSANNSTSLKIASSSSNDTVIILDFTKLDPSVSNMEQVRDQVSFLLSQYRSVATSVGKTSMDVTANDTAVGDDNSKTITIEVICLVESPGGSAADYGLAAQQLLRLRNSPGIRLTVCVDKVAASGGYMLACTAETLLAAPFAIVGSIGVIGQIVNVHKLLEGWGIAPMVFRGGKDKAPLGAIGEVTPEGKAKVQSMIDATHSAFQNHVLAARPMMNIKKVGTGEVWLGMDALDLGLIDRVVTSDEYIGERIASGARMLRMIKCTRRFSPFFLRHNDAIPFATTAAKDQSLLMYYMGGALSSVGNMVGDFLKGASDHLLLGSSSGAGSMTQNSVPDARLVPSLVDSPKRW